MDQIVERLWVGTLQDADDVAALKAAGIQCVVNATAQRATPQDGAYLQLDHDDGVPWAAETLELFLLFLALYLAGEHRRTLIVCGAGVSRSTSLAITWLMEMGMGWDEAEQLVRAKHPPTNPNPALKDSILAYFAKGEAS